MSPVSKVRKKKGNAGRSSDPWAAPRAADQDLLGEFGSWTDDHGLTMDLFVIEAALDLIEDGPWTAHELYELMVESFPRKVTMAESERQEVIRTLHGWIDFLAERHPTRCVDAAALHAEIDRNKAMFLAAMADERNHGPAKFWTARMLENGVDPEDEAQVRRFLAAAQAGEIDYDQDTLAEIMRRGSFDAEIGAFEFDDERDRLLPPVSLPGTGELTTPAASSPLVTRLRAFVTWVGAGRTLTATKRLRVADAKELARLLDVDQPYLERARSSADLPGISLIAEWARAAHLTRVVKGRLVGNKSAAGLLDRPLELWQRAFDAFPGLGAAVCVPASYYEAPALLGQWLPEVALALWLSLYTAGGTPVPVELLVEITRDAMVEPMPLSVVVDAREMFWRRDLAAVLDAMRLTGAVELTTSTDPAERDKLIELSGDDEPDLTFVRLTPLGLWGVRTALREQGFDAPLTEDLAGEPAAVMCDALEYASPEVTEAALAAWIAVRGEDTAAAELAAFCTDAPSASARLMAMNGLAHTGTAGVTQAQRLRSGGGLPGAVATTWLIEHSVINQSTASDQELALALVDNFAALYEHDTLIEDLAAYPVDDQVGFVRALAGTDHPERAGMLTVISTEHPDRAVADAARKAVSGRGRRGVLRAIGRP